MNEKIRLKKYKIKWLETGDNGEVVEEVYVRTAIKIDGLFLRELEKRTGKHVLVFEAFIKELNNRENANILYSDAELFYKDESEGVSCKITLFRTIYSV